MQYFGKKKFRKIIFIMLRLDILFLIAIKASQTNFLPLLQKVSKKGLPACR
jgi:phosphoglycerol transferase MdoB-like AlkP superfamily enzyme